MNQNDLIYDWNAQPADFDYTACRVELNDETLRDGLQSPSVIDPPMSAKVELLHLMAELGIHSADIGLPGAGSRAVEQVRTLAREIVSARLAIAPNCAARTVIKDVEPIVRISQETGIPIEAATFIGSSRFASTPRTGVWSGCSGPAKTRSPSPSGKGCRSCT